LGVKALAGALAWSDFNVKKTIAIVTHIKTLHRFLKGKTPGT
jgi:hypothetical protein